eukprot:2799948-Rhodomonas_salina.1
MLVYIASKLKYPVNTRFPSLPGSTLLLLVLVQTLRVIGDCTKAAAGIFFDLTRVPGAGFEVLDLSSRDAPQLRLGASGACDGTRVPGYPGTSERAVKPWRCFRYVTVPGYPGTRVSSVECRGGASWPAGGAACFLLSMAFGSQLE